MPGMQAYVLSRTLRQSDCPGVTVSDDARGIVEKLKAEPGKDIWLFGGGSFFRSLLALGLVDTVEVAIIPVHRRSSSCPLPGSPLIRPCSYTISPRRVVILGQRVTSQPV